MRFETLNIKNKTVFISYNSISWETVRMVSLFLDEQNIPNYCMKKQNGDYKVTLGENYRKKELEEIDKSCMFIAFLNNEYIQSEECNIEIERAIKNKNIKIIPVYLTNKEELKNKMQYQSWYKGSIFSDQVLYQDKLETNEEINKFNLKILDLYKDIIIVKLNENIQNEHNKNCLNSLVTNSLDKDCQILAISNYILSSGEMKAEKGNELHIITDEIYNYDLTVFACMAISVNILKGVKYVYYTPPEAERAYKMLIEKVKHFCRKDSDSRRQLDRWIRKTYNSNHNVSELIRRLNKIQFSELLSYFDFLSVDEFNKIESILREYKSLFFRANAFKEYDNINSWLEGSGEYDFSKIVKFNQLLEIIYGYISEDKIAKIDNIAQQEFIIRLKNIQEHMSLLVKFSEWQVGNQRLQKEEQSEICDELELDDQIVDWIGHDEVQGEANMSLEDVDTCINENMALIILDNNSNSNLPKLTYSFCLFSSKDSMDCAWYRTAPEIVTLRGNAVPVDNLLIMHNVINPDNQVGDRDELNKFLYAYSRIINSSEDINKVLKEVGSKIVERLSKFNQTEMII